LFILSLLLQYATFAAAPSVLAAHQEDLFELDGNAVDDPANEPDDDWNSTNHAADSIFIGAASEAEANDTTYFTTGGSKDENDIPDWAITSTAVPDKDELTDAYAAVYQKNGDTWVYFGADRFDNDGDAQIGFWFFQNDIGIANGDFTGQHADGDVLVLSEYTNGGVVDLVCAYEWDGSGGGGNIADPGDCDPATSGSNLNLVAAGAACDVADGTFDICARTNAAVATAPWSFTNKDGEHNFATGQFFEGGINLTDMFGGDAPCFGSFLAETRSSQETDAQLKDFALGDSDTYALPDTAARRGGSRGALGGSARGTATLSGTAGPVTGTVTFFVCTPTQVTAAGCPTGGTQVGSAVTIVAGSATSANYTVGTTAAAAGKYCWRAVYAPAADSDYLGASHTNAGTECFTVAPAVIEITKTANPAGPVSAGDAIGFDITVTNSGDGTALGVSGNDPLPSGVDWSAGTPTGDVTGVSCSISGSVGSEVLTCTDASMAPDDSFTVHVSGLTDAADCGEIFNTASVSTTNDGQDEATDSVVVDCPDVTVDKTPDGGTVNAPGTATFTIVVTNLGPGTAHNVTLNDPLPAGVDWSEDSASCSIAAGTLSCNFGDLAEDASATVHVSGSVDTDNCGDLPNTATVAASNEAQDATDNNSDDGSIDVLCAEINVTKTADDAAVQAGSQIGFTVTLSNGGTGTAEGIAFSDDLPGGPGISWSIDPASAGWSITGTAPNQSLVYSPTTLAAGASTSVHVVSDTTADSCGVYDNTASVTTTNDGSDESSASTQVNCSELTIEKSFTGNTGGTDPILNVPAAKIGDTLHYTLTYTGSGQLTNAVITDKIPAGLEYVAGTALGNADFNDGTYDAATRTITWHAKGVLPDPASGSVTYDVKVTAAAPALAQPLVNVATIDSDETEPDSDTASVAVLAPPLELTPPPTNILVPETGTSNPGFALMLVLLGVAGLALGIGFITPVPESVRRKERRR
jgi:uncharacterized repeat protein (TIGR01451 family)/fimbrial isopeptide formation D2 family protein